MASVRLSTLDILLLGDNFPWHDPMGMKQCINISETEAKFYGW